ncbi:hypothetical protein KUTeg_013716 [Tegillarca granosa]|uniref:Microtubule-associated protein 10 C-terminal domain-containing protein n=1 Tax=Tegillarca granosa TaxID=220873 RepID=A0ABQ9EUI1_TEGGR|nr:hypothetical protein KUTeg_013716 [Tegillarca granosa]
MHTGLFLSVNNIMPPKRESLFSLELVVEKLYIPNSTCRFPAVAFRLLDFPTILIEHVEPDLAEKIRHKIKVDPYYTVPHQFHELKDRDGNFLMKKGKSCLFRITTDTLKMHLSNTPLYVMIIDNFPEVPKLMGNSTIPLNEVMDSILTDIRKLGENVPSVHGDKGLYKIYSLMGKEIGYIIMAYRLLSLGPGLIPHIPETAIARRISEKKIVPEKEVKTSSAMTTADVHRFQENLNNTQEMASMTEPEKCDVMLQTIEMCDKQIHVAVSAPDNEEKKIDKKVFYTAGTQTIKQKKQRPIKIKNRLNVELDGSDEDDGMVITDIAQPPPLFYNSEAEPSVKIQHSYSYSDDGSSEYEDDITTESISEKEQVETEKVDVEKNAQNFYDQYRKYPNYNDQQQLVYHKSESIAKKLHYNQGGNRSNVNFLQAFSNMSGSAGAPFPLLNALMNELSRIQSNQIPQVGIQHEQIVSTATTRQVRKEPTVPQVPKTVPKPRYTPKTTVRRVQSVESKIGYEEQDESQFNHRSRKSHKGCAHPHDGVPRQRSWMRQAPELGVKKSKLAFGLTNTQRLRLSKVNPEWLKVIEKEEQEAKAQRKKPGKKEEEPEFETGYLSDTLTEVRRLAAQNLEDGQRNETLNQTDENMQSLPLSEVATPTKKNIRRISPPRRGKSPMGKRRTSPFRKRSRSPKHKKIIQEEAKRHSDITEEESLTKSGKTPATQKASADEIADKELDEDLSSRSQKSIEVRIPSAQMYEDDDSDISLSESDVP